MKLEKILIIMVLMLPCLNAHAQTCKDSITLTTPGNRFTDNGDGTVKDKQTGLIWMRCTLGQTWGGVTCTGDALEYIWQQTLQVADGYSFAGSGEWRVPNINELESIIERACYSPTINLTIFPATPLSSFWSSSPSANGNSVWHASFDNGGNNYDYNGKDGNRYVRLVRSDSD